MDSLHISRIISNNAEASNQETVTNISKADSTTVYFRLIVRKGGACSFSYSYDGKRFVQTGDVFQAAQGKWKGAKAGIFSTGKQKSNDCGFADFDWFRVEPVKE
jgi:hypothetical protein